MLWIFDTRREQQRFSKTLQNAGHWVVRTLESGIGPTTRRREWMVFCEATDEEVSLALVRYAEQLERIVEFGQQRVAELEQEDDGLDPSLLDL